jgi:peptidoglycan/LPS O-acetylase OafA/YrhL
MREMQARTKENAIHPLTSFRFLAAGAVFLSHLAVFGNFAELKPIYERYFYEGYLGVTFFFGLSGFILTYNYHDKIASLNLVELRKFFISRVARIYPVHILTFFLSLPLVYQLFPANPRAEFERAVLNLALVQGFVPIISYYFSFNMPAWSLSCELFFYALLPFILAIWVKIGATTPRRALAMALGLWGLAFSIVWLFQDTTSGHWSFYISPYFRLFDFTLGIAVCFVFLGARRMSHHSRLFFTLMEFGTLAILALLFFTHEQIPQPFRYGVYYTPLIGMIIGVFAFQRGWLSAILSNRFLILAGEISFSFYMFHQLVLRYFLVNDLFAANPVPMAALAFSVTVILSYLCYHLFEMPMRAKIKRTIRATPMSNQIASINPINSDTRTVHPISPVISRRLIGISALVLIAVVGITYLPSLRLAFLGATWNLLEWAARLTVPQNLARAFDLRAQIVEFRPLLTLTSWSEYLAFRFDVVGYHVFEMIVHLANVLLLFALVRKVASNWRLAFISATLFAGLPVYVETLFHLGDFTAESTFFQLLSVWTWIIFLRTKQSRYYALTVGAWILALLAGEQSIIAIVTLFLVDCLLIRDEANWVNLFHRYAPFGAVVSVYLAIEVTVQMNGLGVSTLGWSVGPHAILTFLNYLTLWIFPWSVELSAAYVWISLACLILAYFGIRQRSFVLIFLLLESFVLIGMAIWSSPASITPQYLYMPAMISAILLAALFDWLWTRWGNFRHAQMVLASAVGVIVFVNAMSGADAATIWNETARQRRLPFRDIAQRYPNLPEDTFIYFVEPRYFRDLSGSFLARYGTQVLVGSTADDPEVDGALYPLLQRLGAPIPTTGIGSAQIAAWRGHQNPLVYFFDATGKPIQARVAQDAVTRQTPTFPVNFNTPIRFEGFEITSNVLQRDDTLVLLLYWRAFGPVDKDYTVFLHLINEKSAVVFGEDSQPRGGSSRTSVWTPGQLVVDPHLIPITPAIPAGVYRLEIGLYYLPTMERLQIVDENGTPFADQVVLESFRIE